MELVLIELVLWIGLLFFFWALKEGLGNVEGDIESLGLIRRDGLHPNGPRVLRYYLPEKVTERIGSYRDSPIFRYALIQGTAYQFDRILPPECSMTVATDERCVAPGLIYQQCPRDTQPFS